jgi:hypothetical protein
MVHAPEAEAILHQTTCFWDSMKTRGAQERGPQFAWVRMIPQVLATL